VSRPEPAATEKNSNLPPRNLLLVVHQPEPGIRFEPYRIFLFSWNRLSRSLSKYLFFCMSAALDPAVSLATRGLLRAHARTSAPGRARRFTFPQGQPPPTATHRRISRRIL